MYHSLSDSCNNTRVLSHVPQMSRCVMLACIFIGSWIILLLCSVLRTVSWYCRSGHLPGTLISIVFHAPVEAFLDSLSLCLSFFFFLHLMYIACIVLLLLLLLWFAFTFYFILTNPVLAIFDKKEFAVFLFAACTSNL